jgi:hypothetical protein
MKRKITTVLLLLCLIGAGFQEYNGYSLEKKPLQQQSEKQYQDIISSLLMPYLFQSVGDYYSNFLTEWPLVDPWDIEYLSVERPNDSFEFVVKIQVKPYVGPHNTVGIDIVTLKVGGTGKVIISKYEHIKSLYHDLPDNWQHIIKRN